MSVKSYPPRADMTVMALTNTYDESMGWHRPPGPATFLAMASEQDKQAGERVLAMREQKGWSRETLAYHANVSSKTIERIEKGQVEGRRHTIRAIATALEVDEYAIVGEPTGPQGMPLSAQVDGGFEEFRGHVASIEERLARLERGLDRLETAHADLKTELLDQRAELHAQRRDRREAADAIMGLLKTQSELLERFAAHVARNEEIMRPDALAELVKDTAARTAPAAPTRRASP